MAKRRPAARFTHRVDAYAHAVLAGRIVAGPLVRLACQRHLRDRALAARRVGHPLGFVFSTEAADHIIDFFETVLRLPDTQDADGEPLPFILQPWQVFIVGSLFGWKKADGYRRFRDAYIETGKGSGKSPLLGGVGLYGLTMDGEYAADIYAAATAREQARILWQDASRMVSASPDLSEIIKQTVGSLVYDETSSSFKPLSSEHKQLDGKRPHMALFDEVHEHPDARVVNKLRAGAKGRKQFLAIEITNAGFDRTSVCWQHHEHSRKVLEGVLADEHWFAYVCALDDGDDPLVDRGCWIKTNPNLGVSIQESYLERQVENATNLSNETNTVLRLNFCVWTQANVRAWNMPKWHEAGRVLTFDESELVGARCWAGLDLGQNDDFAAYARLWELESGLLVAKVRFWLPRAALTKYPDRPYAEWERAGLLEVTEGDTTDLDLIEEAILQDATAHGAPLEIAYDKRFAQQMALHLQSEGLAVVDTPQGFGLNEAIKSVSKQIDDLNLAHGNNLILTWQMDNTVLRNGRNKEARLDKDSSKEKIDGPSALVMAESRRIVAAPLEPAEDPVLVTA